jgi:hypothetical protein
MGSEGRWKGGALRSVIIYTAMTFALPTGGILAVTTLTDQAPSGLQDSDGCLVTTLHQVPQTDLTRCFGQAPYIVLVLTRLSFPII